MFGVTKVLLGRNYNFSEKGLFSGLRKSVDILQIFEVDREYAAHRVLPLFRSGSGDYTIRLISCSRTMWAKLSDVIKKQGQIRSQDF